MVGCVVIMLNRRLHFGRSDTTAPDRIYQEDNLKVLETIDDGSVDLVYIDPPFGTGSRRTYANREYPDFDSDPDTFVKWLSPRLAHCRRSLAHHGSLFVHLDYRSVHYVKIALDRIFGRKRFINEIIWCYAVGGKSRRMFGRKHDSILWYAKTADYAFFADAIRVPRRAGSHMRVVRKDNGELVQQKTDRRSGKVYEYPVNRGKIPEDWWADIETLNHSDKQRTTWPTQKPEKLIERIVRATTEPDQLVADWFCGSGTTPVIAQRLQRRFVATDIQPQAIECTANRLRKSGDALATAGTPPRDIEVLVGNAQRVAV